MWDIRFSGNSSVQNRKALAHVELTFCQGETFWCFQFLNSEKTQKISCWCIGSFKNNLIKCPKHMKLPSPGTVRSLPLISVFLSFNKYCTITQRLVSLWRKGVLFPENTELLRFSVPNHIQEGLARDAFSVRAIGIHNLSTPQNIYIKHQMLYIFSSL